MNSRKVNTLCKFFQKLYHNFLLFHLILSYILSYKKASDTKNIRMIIIVLDTTIYFKNDNNKKVSNNFKIPLYFISFYPSRITTTKSKVVNKLIAKLHKGEVYPRAESEFGKLFCIFYCKDEKSHTPRRKLTFIHKTIQVLNLWNIMW